MMEAIKISSRNHKIFEYKGEQVVLLCATEHYGAVMNRPFDYKAYIDDCVEKKQNYTRLFLLFRELQCANNPYSTCKPESPDYLSPYKRVGPGLACDGLPKYDLDIWNDEFFERLHGFLSLCEHNDIIVEVVLFSNSYSKHLLELIPLCSENNINIDESIDFKQVMSMQNANLFEYQKKYVKKIVSELNMYPNFIFEICNEPVSFKKDEVSVDEINRWQDEIVKIVREEEISMQQKHLIAAEECWLFEDEDKPETLLCPTDYMFGDMDIDIVNIHPLPQYIYRNNKYDLGLFMSKQLRLNELKRFCLDTYQENKIVNIDEDNIASAFKDYEAWTIHRKRAWVSIFCGAHYDYIDFSILHNSPCGTSESRKYIRTWYKYIQEYILHMQISSCKPLEDVILSKPDNAVVCVTGIKGSEYNIYLADSRELPDATQGADMNGSITIDVPEGDYSIRAFSPQTGTFSPWMPKVTNSVELPEFTHDIVIQVKKRQVRQ